MRKSASEVINNLEQRIARLENKSAGVSLLNADPNLAKALNSSKLEKKFEFESVTYYSDDPEDTGSEGGEVLVYRFLTSYFWNDGSKHKQNNYAVVTKVGSHRSSTKVNGFFHDLGVATKFAKALADKYEEPKYDY